MDGKSLGPRTFLLQEEQVPEPDIIRLGQRDHRQQSDIGFAPLDAAQMFGVEARRLGCSVLGKTALFAHPAKYRAKRVRCRLELGHQFGTVTDAGLPMVVS